MNVIVDTCMWEMAECRWVAPSREQTDTEQMA